MIGQLVKLISSVDLWVDGNYLRNEPGNLGIIVESLDATNYFKVYWFKHKVTNVMFWSYFEVLS
ncbi:MAG: hypothetical protein Q8P81_03620 [Nanoarchaeota archaeon]|nr:hypothetical protein [Nanoarchaeota archaeon]